MLRVTVSFDPQVKALAPFQCRDAGIPIVPPRNCPLTQSGLQWAPEIVAFMHCAILRSRMLCMAMSPGRLHCSLRLMRYDQGITFLVWGCAGPRSKDILTSGLERLAPGQELPSPEKPAARLAEQRSSGLGNRVDSDIDSDEELSLDDSPQQPMVRLLNMP